MTPLEPEQERAQAVALFNEVWTLLDTAGRTSTQSERLLHMYHARWCLERAEREALPEWVRAEGHEALARAHALSGDLGTARRHADEARAICHLIEDIEDRNVVLGDLATLPLD